MCRIETDTTYHLGGEFGLHERLIGCHATLTHGVIDIIHRRADKEMGRVYTWRVIAGMEDIEPCGDFSDNEFPCNTVCSMMLAMDPEASIAITPLCCQPSPAARGAGVPMRAHLDFRPEACRKLGVQDRR